MRWFKIILLILLIPNFESLCGTNYTMTFSQSSVEDWKQGRRQSFELSTIIDSRNQFNINTLGVQFNLRANLGLLLENGDKVQDDFVRPSANSIFSELMLNYPLGWTLDPYINITANTQILESFIFAKQKTRTAKFRDPITTQQSLGFAYTYNKNRNMLTSKLGFSLKQIRADKHRAMTDDRLTRNILEGYKTETGISFNTNGRVNLDSSITYTFNVDAFSSFDQLETWSVKIENQFDIKIWKFLILQVELNLCYDENQMMKLQYWQSSKIGFLTIF